MKYLFEKVMTTDFWIHDLSPTSLFMSNFGASSGSIGSTIFCSCSWFTQGQPAAESTLTGAIDTWHRSLLTGRHDARCHDNRM